MCGRKLFHIPFGVFGVPGAKDCGKLSLGTEFLKCIVLWQVVAVQNHGWTRGSKRPQVEEMTKNGPGKHQLPSFNHYPQVRPRKNHVFCFGFGLCET